jgi:O-succinylbenzoic acid--CoA ligase
MRFVINNKYIDLQDYKLLKEFVPEFQICRSIILLLDKWFDDSTDSIQFQTSGSTGVPKTISHFKSSMIVSAQITQKAFGFNNGDSALLCLPANYISGFMMLVRSIVADLDLYISDLSTNPLNKVDWNSIDKINFAPMTPMQFEYLYTHNKESLPKFGTILLGGAQVNDLQQKYIQSVDANVYIGYGMTESITHLALKKLNHNPDLNYHVLDGFRIEQNSDDCLIVYADHIHGKIITTDIVELISETEFLWKGRADDIINSGGLKINPKELEDAIDKHIDLPFFISSVKDEKLGEMVVVFVERTKTKSTTEELDLVKNLRDIFEKEKLGNKRPRLLYITGKFKLTGSGKIDRKGVKSSIPENNAIHL